MNVENSAGALAPARQRGSRNWPLLALGGLLLLALLAAIYLLMQSMHDPNTPPADLNTSYTQTSAKGLYQGTIEPDIEPIAINKLHSWRLHIKTVDGQPVDDATITIHGDMPGHGHGLPTEPVVGHELGNGDYLIEGMKFQMPGWWYVDFEIESAKGTDTLRFNLVLE